MLAGTAFSLDGMQEHPFFSLCLNTILYQSKCNSYYALLKLAIPNWNEDPTEAVILII